MNSDKDHCKPPFSLASIRSQDSDPEQGEAKPEFGPLNLCPSAFICGSLLHRHASVPHPHAIEVRAGVRGGDVGLGRRAGLARDPAGHGRDKGMDDPRDIFRHENLSLQGSVSDQDRHTLKFAQTLLATTLGCGDEGMRHRRSFRIKIPTRQFAIVGNAIDSSRTRLRNVEGEELPFA